MSDLTFTFGVNPFGPSNTATVTSFKEYFDGVLLSDENWICATHGHNRPNHFDGTKDITHVAKIIAVVSAYCGAGTTTRLRITFNTTDIKESTFVGSGTHTLTHVWKPRGTPGTPTYLEELHKLDNFTKAQYIPRYRQ